MRNYSVNVRHYGSIFFILVLLAFKCADLHQFSHSDDIIDSCTICQLAHSQGHDVYLPVPDLDFNPLVVTDFSQIVEDIYENLYRVEPFFGIHSNKAPPVRA